MSLGPVNRLILFMAVVFCLRSGRGFFLLKAENNKNVGIEPLFVTHERRFPMFCSLYANPNMRNPECKPSIMKQLQVR